MSVTLARSAVLVVLGVLGILAPAAAAQDRVYWTSFYDGTIQWANLDGSGGIHELNPGSGTISPMGYGMGGGIDPVQERYYYANQEQSKILWASLDGSGGADLPVGSATVSGPSGVSVDPVARRVYWVNESGSVAYANLDGSGGGDLNTTGATMTTPIGATVHPAGGRIYWTNFSGDSIAYADLDGSGGGTLNITGTATIENPFGVAIDAAAGRIYWANDNPGNFAVANLDGSASSDIDRRGLELSGTYGVAIDPEAGLAYTATFSGNTLAFLGTDGSGGATLPIALPIQNGPNTAVIYKTPRATSAPEVARRAPLIPRVKVKNGRRRPAPLPRLIDSSLWCEGGEFAPDLVEARLYRAPVTEHYSLTLEGAQVANAALGSRGKPVPPIGWSWRAKLPGNYRCELVGNNIAGTTTTTSAPVAIFKAGKLKRNLKKGTGRLTVVLPAEKGPLKLSGAGLVSRSRSAGGTTTIVVRAKGRKAAKLEEEGEVRVIAKLTYTPPGGSPATLRTRLTLRVD